MKKLLIALLAIIVISSSALAHPGRTDANGGHWNHSTGEYHYHDGSSAGRSSSGSSSGGGSSEIPAQLVTTGNVNMRSGPGTSYDVITTLPEGTKLPYGGQISGNWYKVWYDSRTGWVHRDYAKVVEWKGRSSSNTYAYSQSGVSTEETKMIYDLIRGTISTMVGSSSTEVPTEGKDEKTSFSVINIVGVLFPTLFFGMVVAFIVFAIKCVFQDHKSIYTLLFLFGPVAVYYIFEWIIKNCLAN